MAEQTEMERRKGIASELADIVHRQRQILAADEVIIRDFPNAIDEHFADLLEQDKKDLALLETVQTNFGLREEPKETSVNLGEHLRATIEDASLTPVERLRAYGMLRHHQVMCGHIVHKVAQRALLDVREALAPFIAVQSEFAKRAGEVMTRVEDLGAHFILGKEPAKGVVGRLRDMGAAIVGAVSRRMAKPSEEMSVLNVLRLDHMKIKALFREMRGEVSPQKLNGLYRQLRSDLLSHSLAEEQVVYAFFKQYGDLRERIEHAWSEHQEFRATLDEMEEYSSISQEFTSRLRNLRMVVLEHVDEEEDEMFKLFKDKVSEEQLVELSASFVEAKKSIQEDLAGIEREEEGDTSISA